MFNLTLGTVQYGLSRCWGSRKPLRDNIEKTGAATHTKIKRSPKRFVPKSVTILELSCKGFVNPMAYYKILISFAGGSQTIVAWVSRFLAQKLWWRYMKSMHRIESALDSVSDRKWQGTLRCELILCKSGKRDQIACGANSDGMDRAVKRQKS